MSLKIFPRSDSNEGGFTLIEVLIAVLVLSIGIFSILAIIINSLRLNSSSVFRTVAAQQAAAIAEVLRANPTTVGTMNAASGVAFAAPGTTAVTPSCLTATGCARNAFVKTSIAMWQLQLAVVLPQGNGTVCQDSTPSDGNPTGWLCDGAANAPYVVKICWDESRISASSSVAGSGGTPSSGGVLCTNTTI
jgi:type IV pilus assembly protein PilV